MNLYRLVVLNARIKIGGYRDHRDDLSRLDQVVCFASCRGLQSERMGMTHSIVKLLGVGTCIVHDDSGGGLAPRHYKQTHQYKNVHRHKYTDNGK